VSGPQAQDTLNTLKRIPELRPGTVGISQEIFGLEVFLSYEVRPQALLPGVKLPDPFCHEADIHNLGVHDPKFPQGF
jgi:hypothetical protein